MLLDEIQNKLIDIGSMVLKRGTLDNNIYRREIQVGRRLAAYESVNEKGRERVASSFKINIKDRKSIITLQKEG